MKVLHLLVEPILILPSSVEEGTEGRCCYKSVLRAPSLLFPPFLVILSGAKDLLLCHSRFSLSFPRSTAGESSVQSVILNLFQDLRGRIQNEINPGGNPDPLAISIPATV